ncbi:hypothetical protein H0H81_003684 [Sphagnurus paluster]|uniref:Uncharacterized protein n=1 Tax=Sphagnurus paluster TaxID=117069 RepID=A0A9P7K5F9_9AGAR|nr:hypothetical protein H0H81_003684 [Sphagnurus paluster]
MENKRAQTLEALETFIQSQRALLARTQSDISRLQNLRNDAASQPALFFSSLDEKFNECAIRLSDQCAGQAQLACTPNIDWAIYEAHGAHPKPLQSLAFTAREKYEGRNKPCPYQRSELSELQKLVKRSRRTLVDPVLAIFECMSEPEDEPEEKLDPEEARRERERAKLRELKKRKIKSWGGLKLPSLQARGLSGVFIRHDVDDESLDVDITLDCDSRTPQSSIMNIDTPTSSTIQPSTHSQVPLACRPSNKEQSKSNRKAKVSSSAPTKGKARVSSPPAETPPTVKKSRGADKPKPETYKQAWSVSEQHLLEQLLEQIPEGEKNRWQKISRAMNGKRTPRQVASRVQKYFEKLKKFGIGEG